MTEVRRERTFNSRWLFLLIILIIVIAVTLIVNLNNRENTAEKVVGTISVDNGDEDIDWGRYPSFEVALTETYNITKSGVYYLTGSIQDGSININLTKNDAVKLVLDNVTIKNSSGPAINCVDGDDLVIEYVGENTLEDGASYSTNFDEDVTGVLYSRADLTIDGTGTLNIIGNHEDGIVAKDDLKIKSGTVNLTAVDDGIRGKDSVYIVGGEFNLTVGADGVKATNETTAGKGFILIEAGTFTIDSGAKGIKAVNSILIYGGEFSINSYDDAIHSNNYVGIVDGDITIDSGDDGVHADRELIIDGGKILIGKCYEGLEAQIITINGGDVSVTSSDDGINAGGGADASSQNRMGANQFDVNEDCVLTINGGDIYINSAGDGVDSNGYLYFNGGKVIVDGPTNNGNGALDSGGGIVMNGGEVIAVGASGMAETLGTGSAIYSISIYFQTIQSAGTEIKITDSNGKTILSHISGKTFNHVAAGSESFKPTETYIIYIDDEEYERFTISSVVTTIGNSYDIMKQRR